MFEEFLVKTVKVKPARIRKLHDMQATRKTIETSFRFLWETNSIKHGDSIIIYFAGHGCKIPTPEGWMASGKKEIEGIFPQDVEPQNVDGRTNFPIPDHTIAAWLNILSYRKGNNIVSDHYRRMCYSVKTHRYRPSSLIAVIPRAAHVLQEALVPKSSMGAFLIISTKNTRFCSKRSPQGSKTDTLLRTCIWLPVVPTNSHWKRMEGENSPNNS